jgi:hypothetical protein
MKIILMSSIIAMISAGIIGTADLIHDLQNGTMIEYDRTDGTSIKANGYKHAAVANSIERSSNKVEHLINSISSESTDISDLRFEDFSRGEPVSMEEMQQTTIIDEPYSQSVPLTTSADSVT